MRRRWRWQWDPGETENYAMATAAVWVFLGCIIVGVIVGVTSDKHGSTTQAGWIALALWAGPMVIVPAAAAIYGLAHVLLRNPPLRRVTEPVRTDLREEQLRRDADA